MFAFRWSSGSGYQLLLKTHPNAHPGGTVEGKAINGSNAVAGWIHNATGWYVPARWDAAGDLTIAQFDQTYQNVAQCTGGMSMNDVGLIAGSICGSLAGGQLAHVAFVWPAGGVVQEIGSLGGANIWVAGVNANGTVVGSADLPSGYRHAWRWTASGGMQDLGALVAVPNISCDAIGVADDEAVVLVVYTGGAHRSFRWTPSAGMQDLGEMPGVPAGGHMAPTAVSRNGVITGSGILPGEGEHAFRWTPGMGFEDLGKLGTGSRGMSVNNSGHVAGLWFGGPGGHRWARWTGPATPINSPPNADAGGPYAAPEGTTIVFNATGSSDADGDALTYDWDFGNGITLSGPYPTPGTDYTDNGTYTVRLIVADPSGLADTATAVVTVSNAPPTTDAGADRDLVQFRANSFSFSFADAGTADSAWTYTVSWGDGTRNTVRTTKEQGLQPNITHNYQHPAVYTLRLAVTDKDGANAFDEATITVFPNFQPYASPNGPYTGSEGTAVQFSSAGSGDWNNDPLTYLWKFGDGTTSTQANPSKTYPDNGAYTVTLTVKDPSGASHTGQSSATITNVAPTGTFTAPATTTEGAAYTLTLNGTDKGTADRPTLQYSFDCGTGAGFGPWQGAKTATCPALPDQRAGALALRGQVRDKDGGLTAYQKNMTVTNVAPVVTFSATTGATFPVGGSLGVTGSFTDKGAADAPWRWSINWGDGTVASTGNAGTQGTLSLPVHQYTRTGTFHARLSVRDKDNKTGLSAKIAVTVTP